MQFAKATAPGLAVPANVESSFAVTQATWRFLANDRVTTSDLVEPLRHFAKQQLADAIYVLAVVDWSKIDYKNHTAKKDITQLTHKHDVGYELTTQLLVDAQSGRPIAPIQMNLKTADGLLSATKEASEAVHHLEQVLPLMQEADEMGFSAKIIHVIDREADSVFHLRQWNAAGFLYLIRGDGDRIVRWRGGHVNGLKIKAQIEAEGAFHWSREVTIKGKRAVQHIAETEIMLDRPAKRKVDGRSVSVHGEPLALRLVIVKAVDSVTGKELSTWYLLTNVPSDVSSATLALWYYWRWGIESYFKLMKSGGQELEHWQQESGLAILKRLLVASMACAVVWSLGCDESVESQAFQSVLVRLSGKRLGRGRSPTPGVLLSGLFVFLRILDFLEHIDYDLSQIAHFKITLEKLLPGLIKNV